MGRNTSIQQSPVLLLTTLFTYVFGSPCTWTVAPRTYSIFVLGVSFSHNVMVVVDAALDGRMTRS